MDFFAGDFFAVDFLAGAFLAVDLLAVVFLAGDFLALVFLVGVFFAAVVLVVAVVLVSPLATAVSLCLTRSLGLATDTTIVPRNAQDMSVGLVNGARRPPRLASHRSRWLRCPRR